jgi:hypothetical protein
MTAMATSPLTIHVDAEAAKAYTSASAEDQKEIQRLLSLRLQELLASARNTGRDRLALLRRGRGIWRDRGDLPTPAELRVEWDRD